MSLELEDAIKQTQNVFRPIFTQPKCSSKLLSKPPFRFIHDIVTATIKSTGFPRNYYTAHELGSKNLKDKTSKLAFLNKLIYLVGVCTGSEVNVRPSKIVAGLEPINTNILLTLFAQVAVNPDIDHTAAVKHCQCGGSIEEFLPRKKVNHRQAESKHNVDRDDDTRKECESKEKFSVKDNEGHNESPEKHCEAKQTDYVSILSEEEKGMESPESLLQRKIELCNTDVRATKELLVKVTTKPKCTDKLLQKPPFRFLHDLIMAVNTSCGLELENIFTNEELDSSNIKSKETKIAFLQKLLDYVIFKLRIPIDFRPNKVVAGLEPEKTCYFLQLLATLALHQRDVRKVNVKNNDGTKTRYDNDNGFKQDASIENESSDLPSDHVEENDHDLNQYTSNEKLKSIPRGGNEKESEDDIILISTTNQDDTSTSKEEKKEEEDDDIIIENSHQQISLMEKESTESNFVETTTQITDDDNKEATIKETSNIERFFGTDEFLPDDTIADDVKQYIRPKTARRRPPKIKDRVQSAEVKINKTEDRLKQRPIIFKDDDSDGLFHNDYDGGNDIDEVYGVDTLNSSKKTTTNQKMKLNPQYIDRQKNQTFKFSRLSSSSSETIKPIPYDLRAISQCIQSIARAAAPIGCVMDYLPTEISNMTKERDYWIDECERQNIELEKVKKITYDEMKIAEAEIDAIEIEIQRMNDLVYKKKEQIMKNDEWIHNHMKRICHA